MIYLIIGLIATSDVVLFLYFWYDSNVKYYVNKEQQHEQEEVNLKYFIEQLKIKT